MAPHIATRPGVLTRDDLDHLIAPLTGWLDERGLAFPTPAQDLLTSALNCEYCRRSAHLERIIS